VKPAAHLLHFQNPARSSQDSQSSGHGEQMPYELRVYPGLHVLHVGYEVHVRHVGQHGKQCLVNVES